MKYIFLIGFCFAAHLISAKNYFVNSKTGQNTYSGETATTPFRDFLQLGKIKLNPGDSVFFARGTLYNGYFSFKHSGTKEEPIVLSCYGIGENPVFSNPGESYAIQIDGDFIVIENLKISQTLESGIVLKGNHNRINNCEITKTGIGITLEGKYSAIFNNNINHLHIVKSTEGGDDDYGAIGILVANGKQEIAYNTIDSCIDKSLDYGVDGGAFEFYGDADSVNIHHNKISYCDGVFEFGAGTITNINFFYNLFLNNGQLGGFHFQGKFYAVVNNILVSNNTLVDTVENKNQVLWFNGTGQEQKIRLVNNIFYFAGFQRFCSTGNYQHTNNLYFTPTDVPIGFTLHSTEQKVDPGFENISTGNFRLLKTSPAIDKGLTIKNDKDYDRNPIVNQPDLGAFEYQIPVH